MNFSPLSFKFKSAPVFEGLKLKSTLLNFWNISLNPKRRFQVRYQFYKRFTSDQVKEPPERYEK